MSAPPAPDEIAAAPKRTPAAAWRGAAIGRGAGRTSRRTRHLARAPRPQERPPRAQPLCPLRAARAPRLRPGALPSAAAAAAPNPRATRAARRRRVVVVSNEFDGKRLVQRHQMIYKLLDDEIKAGVHALSMETKTPGEAGM